MEHCFLRLILHFLCLPSGFLSIKWPTGSNVIISSTLFLQGFGSRIGQRCQCKVSSCNGSFEDKYWYRLTCYSWKHVGVHYSHINKISDSKIGKYNLLAFIFILYLFMNQCILSTPSIHFLYAAMVFGRGTYLLFTKFLPGEQVTGEWFKCLVVR